MPEKVDDCVESVLEDNPDYSENRAWAICKAQSEADVDDVTTESLSDVPIDADALDELAEQSDEWIQESGDLGTAWIDTVEGNAVYQQTRQVRFNNFGGDPFQDEETLEAFIDALTDAGADRVLLGDEEWPDVEGIHDRPVVVEGLSVSEAEAVWDDFADEAVAIAGPQDVDQQQADGFGVDIYRIVQTDPDDGPADVGALLGVAVDMPNAGVYVDWNIDAWPEDEQLTGAHVSDYDNLEDLATVTAGELEPVESVDGLNQQAATDGAVLVNGLSKQARHALESKYNVEITYANE